MELFFLSPGYVNLLLFLFFFFSFHIKGLHAAPLIRERVYTSGIPEESPEEGGGEEDAVPWLHHVWMVGWLIPWFLDWFTDWINLLMSYAMHKWHSTQTGRIPLFFTSIWHFPSVCVTVSFSSTSLLNYSTHNTFFENTVKFFTPLHFLCMWFMSLLI